jgi:hypothetical protein
MLVVNRDVQVTDPQGDVGNMMTVPAGLSIDQIPDRFLAQLHRDHFVDSSDDTTAPKADKVALLNTQQPATE